MRKLKLESLQVESFETTAPAAPSRGTVEGHAEAGTPGCGNTGASYCVACQPTVDPICVPDTYDVNACGETRYHHCSFGCTQYATCRVEYCVTDDNTQRCGVVD